MSAIFHLLNRLAAAALSFLPDSPFTGFIDQIRTIPYLGYLNYFIPISDFLVLLGVWGTAISAFYLYSAILRFVKAID